MQVLAALTPNPALKRSANGAGENTAALSHAAFELRTALERLAVHYWATLLDRKPEEQDLREIASFKRVAVDSSVNGSRISVEYLTQEIPVKTQERRGLQFGNWWRSLIPKSY